MSVIVVICISFIDNNHSVICSDYFTKIARTTTSKGPVDSKPSATTNPRTLALVFASKIFALSKMVYAFTIFTVDKRKIYDSTCAWYIQAF